MRLTQFHLLLAAGLILVAPYCFAAEQPDTVFSVEVVKEQLNFQKKDIASARAVSLGGGKFGVEIKLTDSAAESLAGMTKSNIGSKANIVRDNKIMSSVVIQSGLSGTFIVATPTDDVAREIEKNLSN